MKSTIALLSCAVLLSACSPIEPGNPVTGPTSTVRLPAKPPARTPVPRPTVDAPDVTRQLDIRSWAKRVCGLVTDAEATALGIEAAGELGHDSSQGGYCSWRTDNVEASLLVTVYGQNERVSDLLVNADYDRGDEVSAATIVEQPAIAFHTDRGQTERCVVGVMMADDQSLEISMRAGQGDEGDVCDRALIAAQFAVTKVMND